MGADLELYLLKNEVPLTMRISTLLNTGLRNADFVSLAEELLKQASQEEKSGCKDKVDQLEKLIKARRKHLAAS